MPEPPRFAQKNKYFSCLFSVKKILSNEEYIYKHTNMDKTNENN